MKKTFNSISNLFLTFFIYAVIGWIYEVIWLFILKGEITNRGFLFGPYLPVYGFGMLILIFLLQKVISKKHLLNSNYSYFAIPFSVFFIFMIIVEYSIKGIYKIEDFIHIAGIPLLITIVISIIITFVLKKVVPKAKHKNIDLTPVLIFALIFIITTVIEFIAHYLLDTYFGILLWDYSKDFANINKRVCFDASRNFAIGGTLLLYLVQPKVKKLLQTKKKKKYIITIFLGIIILVDLLITLTK